jgi:hypothetical protein
MSSSDVAQVKANIETTFASVNEALEKLITQYRTLYINDPDDVLRERLGDFCSELEGLRKTINDPHVDLFVRIDSVGDVAEYLDDLVTDVTEYKKEAEAHTFANAIIAITDLLRIGYDSPSLIQKDILEQGSTNENYFKAKQAELTTLAASLNS